MGSNHDNIRITDVRNVLGAIADQGQYRSYVGSDIENVAGHVQSMASYGQYYLMTHSMPSAGSGKLVIINRESGAVVQEIDSPEPNHNHPGGCQVIGDYLAVATETQDHKQGVVRLYDLRLMTDTTPPSLLPLTISQGDSGAGAVGITSVGTGANHRHLVAVYDDGAVTIYESNGLPFEDPACSFVPIPGFNKRLSGRGADSLCLLTDTQDNVFAVAFTSEDLSFTDWAELYRLDLANKDVVYVTSWHMYSDGGDRSGAMGPHFRYGAGLRIRSQDDVWFSCSARNFTLAGDHSIVVNMFRQALPVWPVSGQKTGGPITLSAMGDRLYLIYGDNRSSKIWTTWSGDGQTWADAVPIEGQTCQVAASSAVLNGRLWLVYEDSDGSGQLWVTSRGSDGVWLAGRKIEGQKTGGPITLSTWNGRLCLIYGDNHSSALWVTSSLDGAAWQAAAPIPGQTCKVAAASAVFRDALWLVYEDSDGSGQLWVTSCRPEGGWAAGTRIPNQTTRGPVTLSVMGGMLYLFYGDTQSSAIWVSVSRDGQVWDDTWKLPNQGCTYAASSVFFKDRLWLAYEADGGSGQLWTTRLAP